MHHLAKVIHRDILFEKLMDKLLGRLGDLWGHRFLIYVGLIFIVLSAVLTPLSPTLSIFVMWRVILAIGTSMVDPNAIALVRYGLSDAVGRILGWIGMAPGIAIAVDPTIGGVLMPIAHWYAIFWINIPLPILADVLFFAYGPVVPPSFRRGWKEIGTLVDWLGPVLFAGTIAFALSWTVGLGNHRNGVAIFYAIILFDGLIVVELKSTHPIILINWF